MQFFPFGFSKGEVAGSTELLGGKGAGLLWMANEGVPVPPGFIIPTSVWAEYDKKPKTVLKEIAKVLPVYLDQLKAHFGYVPLLSVRSGARVSCPGMMDTILNVGIEESNVGAWINRLGPKCFGDSFLRLVKMYGHVVKGLREESLGPTLKDALDVYKDKTGEEFPNAKAQLLGAIEAVFKSWDNERAEEYRQTYGYSREWGTAVTVQAMVFGNLNDQSGTGVLFTRNPFTGGMSVTGEWLPNAQGEDIVNGSRTPLPMDKMKEWNPIVHDQLLAQVIGLENAKREMLDIEWTVQDGKLYLLQVRSGKRSGAAALKIALDMVQQGLIDAKEAVGRVSAKQFDQAQLPAVDPKFDKTPAFQGLAACNGVVTGKPVFTKEEAVESKVPCILVTKETTPEDIKGMKAAVGIVTMKGGITCHAAVNARGMNKACIVGVELDVEAFKNFPVLSLDGGTGRIWTEAVPTIGGHTNGVVTAFNKLVRETLGIVPVVFDVPAEPLSEALLYLGDQILTPNKALATVMATLNKVDRLYLDLTPSAEEQAYLRIIETLDPVGNMVMNLNKTAASWPDLFKKLVLIAPAKYPSKLQRIAPGADLRSLILSDAELVLDGIDTSDPAIAKVLAWKQAEGLTVVSFGTYVEGSKSVISVPQALQLIANGKGV